jgi:hypothetical protein
MAETPYQNIDISQNNPLGFQEEIPSVPKTKSNLSPKIIILIALGVFILILFVISLIVTSRRKNENLVAPSITPPPTENVVPTVSKSLLPEIYREKFESIENNLNQDLEIDTPAIDLEIGL